MSTIDLEAITKRLNAATPIEKWKGSVFYNDGAYPVGPYSRDAEVAKRDADFIAHARRDVADLLGVVREMLTTFEAASTHAFRAGVAVGVAKEHAKALGLPVVSTAEPYAKLSAEERQYLAGSTMALRGVLGHVLGQLAGNGAHDERGALIAERLDAVRVLREVCERHGDNDWTDELHLADVIEKHLGRHLDDRDDDDEEIPDEPLSYRLAAPPPPLLSIEVTPEQRETITRMQDSALRPLSVAYDDTAPPPEPTGPDSFGGDDFAENPCTCRVPPNEGDPSCAHERMLMGNPAACARCGRTKGSLDGSCLKHGPF